MIELKNEFLTVQLSTNGGQLVQKVLNTFGKEILNIGLVKAPALFPICGSIRENKVLFHDGEFEGNIPRHSFVRKREFNLDSQTAPHVTFSIVYVMNIRTSYLVENLESEQVLPYFNWKTSCL